MTAAGEYGGVSRVEIIPPVHSARRSSEEPKRFDFNDAQPVNRGDDRRFEAVDQEIKRPQDRSARALVRTEPAIERETRPTFENGTYKPDAAFLAQLIAVKNGEPQTREKRRNDPIETAGSYMAIAQLADRAHTAQPTYIKSL